MKPSSYKKPTKMSKGAHAHGVAYMADGGVVNKLREAVGLPPSTEPTPPTVTGGIRAADGDVVPGVGNKDTQPAMLTPGEFIMPKDSTQKIGVDKLRAMKNATHTPSGQSPGYGVVRMADGGVVPDDSLGARLDPNGTGGYHTVISGLQSIGQGIKNFQRSNADIFAKENPYQASGGADKSPGVSMLALNATDSAPANADSTNQVATEKTRVPAITKPAPVDVAAPQSSNVAPTSVAGGIYPPGDPRGTMSGSIGMNGSISGISPSAPAPQAQQTAPQQKPNIGNDGLATDAGGNPIAGYGSITVGGVQRNLAPVTPAANNQFGISPQSNVLTNNGVPVQDMMNKHFQQMQQHDLDKAMIPARNQAQVLPGDQYFDPQSGMVMHTPSKLMVRQPDGSYKDETPQSSQQSQPKTGASAIQSMSQEIQTKANAIKSKLASGAISRTQAIEQLHDLGIK
jgi:hypothetical protein